MKARLNTLAMCFVALAVSPAQAAFITVDDSDPLNITITAGDFEEGFFVDSNLLTIGVGNSASITFPDGGHTISGSWIDLGATVAGSRVDLLWAELGDPTAVTSGIEFGASTDDIVATLTGSTGGYTGVPYFSTGLATFPQNNPASQGGTLPFLTVQFTPEAIEIPEPSTWAACGFVALAAGPTLRRRLRR